MLIGFLVFSSIYIGAILINLHTCKDIEKMSKTPVENLFHLRQEKQEADDKILPHGTKAQNLIGEDFL